MLIENLDVPGRRIRQTTWVLNSGTLKSQKFWFNTLSPFTWELERHVANRVKYLNCLVFALISCYP